MGFKQLLKKLGKTLFAGLSGAIVGMIISVIYLLVIWMPANLDKMGLGVIVLVPVLIILFSILGLVFGGIFGMIIYFIVSLFRKN